MWILNSSNNALLQNRVRIRSSATDITQGINLANASEIALQGNEIDDATFVRRAYLDIVGRVPTIEEAENFHGSDYPQKRARLIADLLESEISKRMKAENIDRDAAYLKCKSDPALSALFGAMQDPTRKTA